MKAVAYVRVSSTLQLTADGPERQTEFVTAYAARNNLEIANFFVDDVTGSKDTVDRPGWNAMLAYCEEHGIRAILIEKIDRLQREPIVGELLLNQCREKSIAVVDCCTGMNFAQESENPYVRFLQRILRDAAAFNKDVMVYHTSRARARIRQSGKKCEGRKGYRDLPEFTQTLQRITELSGAGLGPSAIARHLNREQVPTMNGEPWKRGTVHRLLKESGTLSAESA